MMPNYKLKVTSLVFLIVLGLVQHSLGFSPTPWHTTGSSTSHKIRHISTHVPSFKNTESKYVSTSLNMGFFDGISKAFTNQDYKTQDQRVRASHILIKGDDVSQVLTKINQIMGELNECVAQVDTSESAMGNIGVVQPIFSKLAQRESQCNSATLGGDLGSFAPGKMVREFDAVIFPNEGMEGGEQVVPPPVGSLLGPVITDFGMHMILITERDVNRDQVEEKLARND